MPHGDPGEVHSVAVKVECPECAALQEPEWVRAKVSGDLEVKCSACGVVSVMEARAFRPSDADRGPVTCPKCSHKQQNPDSCDRCGLVFANWDPGRAVAPTDEAAEALWNAVDRAWAEDAKHRAFLEYCTTMGLYAYAAQQYGRARGDEGRRARAAGEIERLTVLAQTALAASQPRTARVSIRRIRTVMVVVTLVVSAAMLLFVATRFL